MNTLFLGKFEDQTQEHILAYIKEEYEAIDEELKDIELIVAHEDDLGDYEEESFFLYRKGDTLYENHASHCSCYGFEEQWSPEKTTVEYLLSDHFNCEGGPTIVARIKKFLHLTFAVG